ncbi:MAG: hypothetical protein HON90_10805 [Halobacteriovoraceae bacterium]|jgi:hypothetical protein|nr:hypothetical protein [Halobacteriovoraceae bacterium]
MMKNPLTLKNEARDEAYKYFDKNIRTLPKYKNGEIDSTAHGLENNDVDAFRHAHVSGVFTIVYNETTADLLGRANEYFPNGWYSNTVNPGSLNMDLWNNSIGRKYGKKSKDRKELLKLIHKALNEGELIIELQDDRKYEGKTSDTIIKSKPIIVLNEDENGRNVLFFDMVMQTILTREEFVMAIKSGNYPSYTVKNIKGLPTPVSKPDGRKTNNLS